MDGAKRSGRVEGVIAIAQPVNANQPPQITLKLIRQSGERELIAQEVQLSAEDAERLAQFLCAMVRDHTPPPRRRRRRLTR